MSQDPVLYRLYEVLVVYGVSPPHHSLFKRILTPITYSTHTRHSLPKRYFLFPHTMSPANPSYSSATESCPLSTSERLSSERRTRRVIGWSSPWMERCVVFRGVLDGRLMCGCVVVLALFVDW